MKKVPNSVFLLIAIVALAAAGVLYALFSSERERSFNSLNEIAALKNTNETLMNKNSDLMMQIGGLEDQKNKLEGEVKKDNPKCDTDECLNIFGSSVYGLATIEGYYIKEEVEDRGLNTGDEAVTLSCDRFVVTGGPEKLINAYKSNAEAGNTFFDKNDSGQPVINIRLNSLVKEERETLLASVSDKPVKLIVFESYKSGVGLEDVDACYSLSEVLRVK